MAALERAGLSSSLVRFFFDNPGTFLIEKGDRSVDAALPDATAVRSFASYATMQQAIISGTLGTQVRAVIYDNEHWSFTPTNEQQQPIQYAQRAASLAHQHGLRLIFTPAINLASLLSPGAVSSGSGSASTSKYNAYLSLRLAAQGAQVSDAFEIQAQQVEATAQFAGFVTAAVSQARTANPRALILLGIATNPLGRMVSPQDLMAAYSLTRSQVAGYWLNIPGASAQCLTCGNAQPQVGVGFLEDLAHTLGQ